MKNKPTPGTKVKNSPTYLRLTGSKETRKWIVVECSCGLCDGGRHVAVDEPSLDDPDRPRHIHFGNLEKAR